jgi:polysaccharide export outer membrane protein
MAGSMKLTRERIRSSLQALALLLSLCAGVAMAAVSTAPTDFPLGAGDMLKVSVFDHPELATDLRVSQAGTITFPLLGEIKADGLSPHELERALARGLADGGFVRQPQVTVLVTDYQSQRISVLGQVTKPGQYPLMTETTVIGALAAAGGVVNPLGADEATVLRRNGTRVPVDLVALFQGDARQNVTLGSGDTLFVPRAPQFYIYGAVQHPGVYRLERGMTVAQAISAGGGLTARGSDRHILIKRREYAGGKEKELSADDQELVQPDDVLRVKESLF